MSSEAHTTDPQENLLDRLQMVLEQQEQMIKKDDFHRVEKLCEQANAIIAEFTQNASPQQPEWAEHRQRLARQYKKIELMLDAKKDSLQKQLQKVGSGKKTIQAYQGNF